MGVSFTHRESHAVVQFSGDVTWDSILEVINVVDTLLHVYFYNEIELMIVSSHGGRVDALVHYLATVERWRADGMRLRTRVVHTAESAAVLMAATGDERICEPGATLFLHEPSLEVNRTVTRRDSRAQHGHLREIAHLIERRLAQCALASAGAVSTSGSAGADPSDREVLEGLGRLLRVGRSKRRRTLEGLARAVGQVVEDAGRTQDAGALARLYRHLSTKNARISASLACTLRLVDRVETVGARHNESTPRPARDGLVVPEWRGLFAPDGAVARAILTRHVLVLGETGSGKTASAVLPLAAAAVRAPELGAALVIDPKRELALALERLAPDRVVRVKASSLVLNFMAGPRWSLERDLAAGRWLTAAEKILFRTASFSPWSPARVLGDHVVTNASMEFFDREGTDLTAAALAFVLMVLHPPRGTPKRWIDGDEPAWSWVRQLIARARGDATERGPNAVALAAFVVDTALAPCHGHTIVLGADAERVPERWLFARVAGPAMGVWGADGGEGREVLERICGYWADQSRVDKQYAGVWSSARIVCADLAQRVLARSLYTGCEPGYAQAGASHRYDAAHEVSRYGSGRVTVFQPARDALEALLAKVLKAQFFEAVLDDPDRSAGHPDLPLVGYVADEFHRFATSATTHGEQSFLDTCRSYGAFCLLACQSMASIGHALSHGGGDAERNQAAMSILWNNTGTKLVFRTTDENTCDRVAEVAPHHPGLAGVTRVRPLSTLRPGECYAMVADGRFERRRLDPFDFERLLGRDAEKARGQGM